MFLVSPEELQNRLAPKACQLGADAVIVTQEYAVHRGVSTMTGVAIKFRGTSSH
jgi:hypothetical protein